MSEPLDWTGDAPRSPRFDDIYFSPVDGLAETQAVFLQGCGLPDGWIGRQRFTVGELGFGTGLNILALINLWRQTRPAANAVLHVFSIESFPMSSADAARALKAWPDLADLATVLLADWPGGRQGFHRYEWPSLGVILDLAFLDVEAALTAWSGYADAWFLDGFAPSKNPQMWRPEVMALIAARSTAGARAATFSVAGPVRRGLEAAGFVLTRAPGFGRKKERLEATLRADLEVRTTDRGPIGRVAIIGAGIAGAALARAFNRLGVAVTVFDQSRAGGGASGNPSALVTPRLDAGLNLSAQLHAQAFARAIQLYRREASRAIIAEGALQLAAHDRDAHRFAKIVDWNGFDLDTVVELDPVSAADAINEARAPQALGLRNALVIEPSAVLGAWLPAKTVQAHIERLVRYGDGWRLLDERGCVVAEAQTICLAAGPATSRLTSGVPLRAVRGQVSFTDAAAFSGAAASFGGYAIPTRNGVLFGATHDRDDWDEQTRVADDVLNLESLHRSRPALAARLDRAVLSSRASLRAMAHDYLPVASSVPGSPGLFVLSGLGGRGFTLAPLLAEAVAAQAFGAPSPLPRTLSRIVDLARLAR